MKAEIEESIIEHIRSLKEENAAEYGFSLEAIINAARERQEVSGRRVIRVNNVEPRRMYCRLPANTSLVEQVRGEHGEWFKME